jgi:hypothetical protein
MKTLAGWNTKVLAGTLLFLAGTACAGEPAQKSETHSFKVRGNISYRCYSGSGAQKNTDSRTKAPCDSQTRKQTLVDEVIQIEIKAEPNPDDSKDLYGEWKKDIDFEGRKFSAFLSLAKSVDTPSKTPYRLMVDANDDEPGHRRTTTSADARQVKDFNILTLRYASKEQPEEIEYDLLIEAVQ